jgi:hypothetical protein
MGKAGQGVYDSGVKRNVVERQSANDDGRTLTTDRDYIKSRGRYRFAVAILLIAVALLAVLYIDLASRHGKLEGDYTAASVEASSLRAKLSQVDSLLATARGPNGEYTSPNLVLAYSYWFSYYDSNDSNRTSGKPYVCLYVPEANSTIEVYVESIIVGSNTSHFTIQDGTPEMDKPIPDLFTGTYVGRFNSFNFSVPSVGWYTVSLVGHVTPNFDSPGPGGSWIIDGSYYELEAQLRVIRSGQASLFAVGAWVPM